ncbi:hypothetical protein D3C81_1784540 [compost metagenome]
MKRRVCHDTLEFSSSSVFLAYQLDSVLHFLNLLVQFILISAACFSIQLHIIRDNIRSPTAFEFADVGRCFLINTSQIHTGNDLSGYLNSTDSILRINTCMSRLAKNFNIDLSTGRR